MANTKNASAKLLLLGNREGAILVDSETGMALGSTQLSAKARQRLDDDPLPSEPHLAVIPHPNSKLTRN